MQRLKSIGGSVLLLGEEPVAPAGAVTVHLPGAVIDIDPGRPDLMPSCLVGDLEWVSPMVSELYGDDAVAAMVDAVTGTSPRLSEVRVTDEPSMALLRRLAEVRWLRDTAPVPLDPWLLEVEEQLLVGQLEGVLDDTEGWRDRLAGMIGALLRDGGAAGRAMAQPLVVGLVTQAIEAAGGGAEDLKVWGTPMPGTGRGEVGDWPQLLRPQFALAASARGLAGRCTVDWRDVPPGTTSQEEDNVAWHAELSEEDVRVRVAVAGAPEVTWLMGQPAAPQELRFDVLGEGLPTPILTGELTPGADRQWRGEAVGSPVQGDVLLRLDAAGRGIRVRVRAVGPRDEEAMPDRAAYRWAARGVAAMRLYVASGDEAYRDAGIAALSQAEQEWRSANRPAEADAVEELLARVAGEELRQTWGVTCTVAELVFAGSTAGR